MASNARKRVNAAKRLMAQEAARIYDPRETQRQNAQEFFANGTAERVFRKYQRLEQNRIGQPGQPAEAFQ